MRSRAPLLLVLSGISAGCRPELGEPSWLVSEARIAAVRAEPAELDPGAAVSYRALVVGPEALLASESIQWAFCATPKPLGENASVASDCLEDAVRPIGVGASLATTIPADACALFGSEVTSPDIRPRDPDSTGGYYQPVRALLGDQASIGRTRIHCDLRNASLDVVRLWTERYRPNINPSIVSLSVFVGEIATDFARLPRAAEVELQVELESSSAESYVVFDEPSQSLFDARESLQVSWLATAGELAVPRSEATGEPPTARVRFRVPGSGGALQLYAVVRDGRGGVDFVAQELSVEP